MIGPETGQMNWGAPAGGEEPAPVELCAAARSWAASCSLAACSAFDSDTSSEIALRVAASAFALVDRVPASW